MQAILATVAATSALVAQAPSLPSGASGVVVDAATGAPLAGVLVQQEGSVTSVFTAPEGQFKLLLDRTGQPSLTVSSVGYETVILPIGSGQNLRVKLKPIAGFIPSTPNLPGKATAAAQLDDSPLHSGVSFQYRLRYQNLNQGNANVWGLANNDYRLGARFRWSPWLFEGEGSHYETPIDVAGLPREDNPAFKPSSWQFGARASYLFPIDRDLETAVGLGYRYNSVVPNNNNIPYLGSGIDFEQTRHAVGPVGTIAYRPGRGKWHYEGSLGLMPVVSSWAKAPGTAFGNQFLTDLRTAATYEIIPGFRMGLGYQFEDWRGNGADSSHMLSVNVFYTPGGVPVKSEEP